MASSTGQLLRLGDAAERARVSPPTLRAAIDRGEVPSRRHGSQRLVFTRDLDRWSASRPASPPTPPLPELVADVLGPIRDGYALGGYAVISLDHPGYRIAPTAWTVWASHARFDQLAARLGGDPRAREHRRDDRLVGLTVTDRTSVITVLPWPAFLGHLVTRRGDALRRLTPERLVLSVAVEQVIRQATGSRPDIDTLAVLLATPGLSLATLLTSLSAAPAGGVVALPIGVRRVSDAIAAADIVERCRGLIASILRRLGEPGTGSRPLGRTEWREVATAVAPAHIDDDRLRALLASV